MVNPPPYSVASAPGPIPGISFGHAFVRFWTKGLTFSGRASRSEFWYAWLVNVPAATFLLLLGVLISASSSSGSGFGSFVTIVGVLYLLASTIPGLALVVRRLHDTNRSAVWILLEFVPFGSIVLLIILAMESDPAGARWDQPLGPPTSAPAFAPTTGPVPPPPLPPLPSAAPAFAASDPMRSPAPAAPAGAPPVLIGSVPPVPPPPLASAPVPVPPAPALAAPVPLVASTPFAPAAPSASVDLDSTRMSLPLATAEWTIVVPDGRTVPLTSAVLFGRAPSDAGGSASAVLVPVDDPDKSMSKTHARLDLAGDNVTVTDLHSTNGTSVVVGDVTTTLPPGSPWPLSAGATVVFGKYAVELRRR